MSIAFVVAAGPNDEALGWGGMIAWIVSSGWKAHMFSVAEGVTSRIPHRQVVTAQDSLDRLTGCARKASEILGVESPNFPGLPDDRLESVNRVK
ncbi:MAG TPA: PIG-L family deacetylase [Atribacteraceae bacterium]|nr:PIG-L family deacetylase [Atribacteraceae bacterium]